jgi:hypothetical protein
MSDYVYCFSNPGFRENIFKIGRGNWEDRLKNANSPDTYKSPYNYVAVIVIKVPDSVDAEKVIHARLDDCRIKVNSQTEFFCCDIERIKREFSRIEGGIFLIGNPASMITLDQFRTKVQDLKFETAEEYTLNIPKGFPTLDDIAYGYFDGHRSFHTIMGTLSQRNDRFR